MIVIQDNEGKLFSEFRYLGSLSVHNMHPAWVDFKKDPAGQVAMFDTTENADITADELRKRGIEVTVRDLSAVSPDVRRYQRLRVIGCAPYGSKQLRTGNTLCFTNLDDFVDGDLKAHPSRGEHKETVSC